MCLEAQSTHFSCFLVPSFSATFCSLTKDWSGEGHRSAGRGQGKVRILNAATGTTLAYFNSPLAILVKRQGRQFLVPILGLLLRAWRRFWSDISLSLCFWWLETVSEEPAALEGLTRRSLPWTIRWCTCCLQVPSFALRMPPLNKTNRSSRLELTGRGREAACFHEASGGKRH